ncbi:MAG: M48 family metallopeptidase, partial [Opitutales bacterium]
AEIAPPEEWEFVLFASEQINAFALPGGKVGFYEGILELMDNESQVATVMAHEIAHVVADHGGERVTQQLGVSAIGAGLAVGLGSSDVSPTTQQAIMAAYGTGSQLGVLLPFSRTHESEADEIGLIYMAEAGYDPREAVAFWQNMKAAAGDGAPPEFLSTHPSHDTRIEDLRAMIPDVMPIYEANSR